MKIETQNAPVDFKLHQEYSAELQQSLGLDGSPVAMAILDRPPKSNKRRTYLTACIMVQIARFGDSIYSSGKGILCGARASLGMGRSPINKLDEFLVEKEKLFETKKAARSLLDSMEKQAPEGGNYLACSPLEAAAFIPDVVLFVATPAIVSRIIFLNAFETGDTEALHGEPLCFGAIARPMTTGKPGISFMDMACRKFGKYRPEEMIIGIPYSRLPAIVRSIDHSSAGTAKQDILLSLAGTVLQTRVHR